MKNKKKGFTVVELVIVIAVIAILSAILIPTFVGLTNKAQEAALQENLRNSYVAYAADKAETTDLVAREEVVFSKTEITTGSAQENVVAYKYNAVKDKWEKETLNGTFTAVAADAYNGYYLYTFVAAA